MLALGQRLWLASSSVLFLQNIKGVLDEGGGLQPTLNCFNEIESVCSVNSSDVKD